LRQGNRYNIQELAPRVVKGRKRQNILILDKNTEHLYQYASRGSEGDTDQMIINTKKGGKITVAELLATDRELFPRRSHVLMDPLLALSTLRGNKR
jgi:hypothetical protein